MKTVKIKFTPEELTYIETEIDCLLRHYGVPCCSPRHARRSYEHELWENANGVAAGSFCTWIFSNPNMATGLNKLYFVACGRMHYALNESAKLIATSKMPITKNGVTTIVFTKKETKHLIRVMDHLLKEFSKYSGYNGRKYTNPIIANAFGKVYYALNGQMHANLRPEHYNAVVQYHIEGVKQNNPNSKMIAEFYAMLK